MLSTTVAEVEFKGLPEGFGLTTMVCGTELDSVVLSVVVVETRLSNRNVSLLLLLVALFVELVEFVKLVLFCPLAIA